MLYCGIMKLLFTVYKRNSKRLSIPVLIQLKDGSVRLCIDYSALNKGSFADILAEMVWFCMVFSLLSRLNRNLKIEREKLTLVPSIRQLWVS